MAGTTSGAKSALAKEEFRRLMKERSAKKIDAPFAKYEANGQLVCILCKVQIKTDAAWTAHANGRQHHEAIAAAKPKPVSSGASAGKTASASVFAVPQMRPAEKRPSDALGDSSLKKLKISDRAQEKPLRTLADTSEIPEDFFDEPQPALTLSGPPNAASTPVALPDNFFDKPTKNIRQKQEREKKLQEEDEWAQFQKAINEESHKSSAVVEHDDDEAKRKRELDEIEEQLVRWEKLHDLELKKEEVAKKVAASESAMDVSGGEDDDGDDVGDDFNMMDWRRRKLF